MTINKLPLYSIFASAVSFLLPEEADSKQLEIDSIDDKLKQLTERKAELQNSLESILNAKVKNSKKGKSTFTVP